MDNLLDRLISWGARLWYRLDRHHRLTTLRNLEFAYGSQLTPREREQLALRVFEHFIRIGWELLPLLFLPLSRLRRRLLVIGEENVEAALAAGKGILVVTGHVGNWEYTALAYGLAWRPLVVVGRDHDHPLVRRLIRYLRQRGRNRMIPKQGGLAAILAELHRNQIVCLLVDQNTATRDGILVDFFGHRARTTPIAGIIARRYDIPVVPVLSRRLADGRHLLVILPALPMAKTSRSRLDVAEQVQLQTRIIEAWIRRYPEQWLWLHKRWKNQYPELYRDL